MSKEEVEEFLQKKEEKYTSIIENYKWVFSTIPSLSFRKFFPVNKCSS